MSQTDLRRNAESVLAAWGLADPIQLDGATAAALTDPAALAAHLDPRYVRRTHTDLIAAEIAALGARAFDRLAVNTPPQVGKTTTAVEWGAFWWLCLHPGDRIVIGSYGDSLAVRRGKAIRRLVSLYGHRFDLRIATGSASMKDWELTSGGGVRSVGVGSGVTGHAANLIIVDDPIKNRAEAESPDRRQKIHDWYSADILSRQSPGCPVLLIMTPWHPDDLRARVIGDEGRLDQGGRWATLVLPALAREADPLGRAPGEPLPHPKLPVDTAVLLHHWEQIRAGSMPRDWAALWDCDPQPVEGALLPWDVLRQRRCWSETSDSYPCAQPGLIVAVAVDPSGGGRDTAGVIGGYLGTDQRLYLTHDRSGVMPSDGWARAACELAADTGADRFVVERNFGGDMAALVLRTAWEALRREDPGRFGMMIPRIVEVTARRGKLLRAEPIAQQWIEDRIRLARPLPEMENEWATWRPGLDSPGRIDASVHLAYQLLPMPSSGEPSALGAALLSQTSLLPWGRS